MKNIPRILLGSLTAIAFIAPANAQGTTEPSSSQAPTLVPLVMFLS